MLRVQPDSNETQLQHDFEREYFEKYLPVVLHFEREKVTHQNLDVDVDDVLNEPNELNANWDNQNKLKELRNGVYVETKKLELQFSIDQLEDRGITLKKGDLLQFGQDKVTAVAEANGDYEEYITGVDPSDVFEILQTRTGGLIRGTNQRLFIIATIDLEHKWSP